MEQLKALSDFLQAAAGDARISATHISIYVALLQHWQENGFKNPLCVFSKDVMKYAKISGAATYRKIIKDLSDFGYINYEPSFNHFKGSLISLTS